MGRKRNVDTGAKGADPTCPSAHTLRRDVADGAFECDLCNTDILEGCCFYGCKPCDYSLCGGCYVKLATGGLDNTADASAPEVTPLVAEAPRMDPDIADLCDHYEIEERVMLILNDAMKGRPETFSADILGLWESLATARSPAGLLMAKIRMMKEGTFVGKVDPPPDVKRVIQKFRLDEDARTKLTDFYCKRPNTCTADLFEIERRLENSGKPSAVVMTMIMALQKGTKLPEMRAAAPHRDYGQLKGRPGGGAPASASGKDVKDTKDRKDNDRDRDRDRDRRKSRSRSRERR